MRTTIMLAAIGIAVAFVAAIFAGPTSADQLVGPTSATLALTGGTAGVSHAPDVMLVKGGKKQGNHGGHHKWRHHWDRQWYGYPNYGWDSGFDDSSFTNCVWNGYSYTCYKRSDTY